MPPRNQVAVTCEVCAVVFSVPASAAATRRFCSRMCLNKWRSVAFAGPNNPTWKEGSRVERMCEVCGTQFETRAREVARGAGRFCSRICKARGARPAVRINRICETCGKQFESFPADIARGHGRFCSRACRPQTRPTKQVQRSCEICGAAFTTRLWSLERGYGRFCSMACRGKWLDSLPPQQQPAWKGGLSFLPYPPTFNEDFKTRIRERDRYCCAICGMWGNEVHHINYVKLDTHPENCITLCNVCHGKTSGGRRPFWQALCTEIMALRGWGLASRATITV